MNLPETRNTKGEDHGRFAAEMLALARDPRMKPFLTSTEAKRQAKEAEREAAEEQKRKEAWLIEAKRRDDLTAQWFNQQMNQLAPKLWQSFKKAGDPKPLNLAGWELIADMTTATKPDHEPTPCTVCTIKKNGKAKRIERLVWEEPKPIASKLVTP